MQLRGSRTERNLLRTFSGESRARNKYTFYAEKARKEGYEYVADIFEETANNEKAHARFVFDNILRFNKTTAQNLLDAAIGEREETNNLYKEFEMVAREEGFFEIADFYKELGEVEELHQKRYEEIRKSLVNDEMFKRDTVEKWHCLNCGYIHEGFEAPHVCPLCKYPQAFYEMYCENFKSEEGK